MLILQSISLHTKQASLSVSVSLALSLSLAILLFPPNFFASARKIFNRERQESSL